MPPGNVSPMRGDGGCVERAATRGCAIGDAFTSPALGLTQPYDIGVVT